MDRLNIKDAFNAIILGKEVKRSVHHLVYNETDYSNLFISCLKSNQYNPVPLKDIDLKIGTRYPGFYIIDSIAYFGHLFWEVFSTTRKRKIWGSLVRNEKGDWKYILSGNSSKIVYLNSHKAEEVDIFHLT